jgi:hypothetical protein
VEPDGQGRTLVLRDPASLPDHAQPSSWRAGVIENGTPGAPDPGISFGSWVAQFPGVTNDPEADDDFDGLTNRIEYAFSRVPTTPNASPYLAAGAQNYTVLGNPGLYAYVQFSRPAYATDLTHAVRFSDDLAAWNDGGVLVSSVPGPNDTVIETWRSSDPIGTDQRLFIQVQLE